MRKQVIPCVFVTPEVATSLLPTYQIVALCLGRHQKFAARRLKTNLTKVNLTDSSSTYLSPPEQGKPVHNWLINDPSL